MVSRQTQVLLVLTKTIFAIPFQSDNVTYDACFDVPGDDKDGPVCDTAESGSPPVLAKCVSQGRRKDMLST